MAIVRIIDKRTRKQNAKLLGGLLHVAREEVGLTQTDLARRLGKEQSFVSKYETGECYLDVTEFILICNELCVDPAEKLKQLQECGVGFAKEQRDGQSVRKR